MPTLTTDGPSTATLEVARRFALDLKDSEAAVAIASAQERLRTATDTQALLEEYRELHRDLGWRARTGVLEEAEADQLAELRSRVESDPAIIALQSAQDVLRTTCQEAGAVLSARVGLDLATACGSGCCG